MHILPMGPTAVLVDELTDPAGWSLGLRALELDDVVDVVPAARTVLVRVSEPVHLAGVVERFGEVRDAAPAGAAGDLIEIVVRYDGDDLADVAAAVGVSTDTVVERHAAGEYDVAFCGFAPGFAYLRGLPAELHLPRRATPRTRVPAGAVAIAAGYTAVYPRASPGGWHLLGTTDVVLFDPHADPPARLTPGTRVRFVPR